MAKKELVDYSIANSGNAGKAKTSVGWETPDETSSRARSLLSSMDNQSSVNADYRSLGNEGSVEDAAQGLEDTLGTPSNFEENRNTIMETFRDRRRIAKEGGRSERELIDSRSSDSIASTLDANAREYINAQEGRAGFGTKTAAVRYMEDSGAKRVRDLEKQRDDMMLQSKMMEASRLDNLIAQEQTAITEARTQFVNEILGISAEGRSLDANERANSQEERTALGFETPEEARVRDLEIGMQESMELAVNELAIAAPDAGISSSDTYDEAVAKYRNSETYKRNERAAELELDQIEASIANTRSLIGERNASNSSISTTESGTYSTDLDALVGNARLIAGQTGKYYLAEFQNQLSNARDDADKINTIANVVLQNSTAKVKDDFRNQADGLKNINEAIALIESGVQTGAIPATKQYLFNFVGKDFDPELTKAGQRIVAALQPYRSTITGAAWGTQEDAEYEKMFGSTKYEPDELLTRLYGIRDILVGKSAGALNSQVNALGTYGDVFTPALENQWLSPESIEQDNNMFSGSL